MGRPIPADKNVPRCIKCGQPMRAGAVEATERSILTVFECHLCRTAQTVIGSK
jgi:hypothetical protein